MTRRKPIARTCLGTGPLVFVVMVEVRGGDSGAYEGERDDGFKACCHGGVVSCALEGGGGLGCRGGHAPG